MKKISFVVFFLAIISVSGAFSQDAFSGVYCAANQAQYDSEKKWIEISRNKYQEISITSESYSNEVGYYDSENREIFFVLERAAQFNSLMKIRIIDDRTIEVYMLADNKWIKSGFTFKK